MKIYPHSKYMFAHTLSELCEHIEDNIEEDRTNKGKNIKKLDALDKQLQKIFLARREENIGKS